MLQMPEPKPKPYAEIDGIQHRFVMELRAAAESEKRLFPATEIDVGFAFAATFDGLIKFDHKAGTWFEWDGFLWREQESGQTFDRILKVCAEISNTDARKTKFARGVETTAKNARNVALTTVAWNRDPLLLGTPDGMVDLRTGELLPPSRDDLITKSTAITPAETASCPKWLAFLKQATNGDEALIRFLRQWAGYGLTGDTREQKLVFIWGDGGNGKGVFINTLAKIMANYATKAAMDTFIASKQSRHPTELAYLHGARMVHAAETDEGRAWDEAKVKELTGGDLISARLMRQNFYQFLPSFTLTIIGNYKPVLRNVGPSVRRRFLIIPFIHKPKVANLELEEQLKAEWPGILRWMIDGAIDWQENGLVVPDVVTKATEAYFSAQDLIGEWIAEECDADVGNDHRKGAPSALFAAWSAFAKRHNEEPGTQRSFGDALEARGFARGRNNAVGRFHEGIELRKPPSRDEEA